MTVLACRLFRSIALGIILNLAAVSLALPQQPTHPTSAPVPPQILDAKKVFISNAGGDGLFNSIVDGGLDRAYNQFYHDILQWGRYQIVSSPTGADLIFEVSAIAPVSSVNVTQGSGSSTYAPQLRLKIIEPSTQSNLWTMTAALNSLAGFKKTRDKKFDAGVINLVNQLRQLVGEQLTADEASAIHRSLSASTGEKVFVAVAVAALVTSIAVGIHMATSHPTPALPTIPACQTPPFCPVTLSR